MGIFSSLNPIGFGRKYQSAWNAAMSAYTFFNLSSVNQQIILARTEDILDKEFQTNIDALLKNRRIVFFNVIAKDMGDAGINPALGEEKWFWIKNPFVDCIGAEEMLPIQIQQIERKFNIKIAEKMGL